ncbi:MAG: DUF1963 domain-containing protein [Aggregatilineales bacterium]
MSSELLIDKLRAYCRAKPGVDENLNVFGAERPTYQVLGGLHFAEFYLEQMPCCLSLRCGNDRLRQLQTIYSSRIQISGKMKWDTIGWKWAHVLLDGTIPESELFQLIDDSYAIVYAELSETDKQFIVISTQNLSIHDYLQKLMELHDLKHRGAEIEQLIKPAILLKTRATDETQIALGQTKIGGLPDLPYGWEWPIKEKMPLAFLAQINLSEISEALHQGLLPKHGILYFFSIFGWHLEDGDLPPTIPWDRCFSEPGWSRTLFFTGEASLLRRVPKPIDVDMQIFRSAQVEYETIPSLPYLGNFARDPTVDPLDWSEREYEQFDDLYCNFARILTKVWGFTGQHQLFGYASPIQNPVTRPGVRLLFQIDSDSQIDAMWGDGGMIYFAIFEDDLRRHDFSRLVVDYQNN